MLVGSCRPRLGRHIDRVSVDIWAECRSPHQPIVSTDTRSTDALSTHDPSFAGRLVYLSNNPLAYNSSESSSISMISLKLFKSLTLSSGGEILTNTPWWDDFLIGNCNTIYTASCALISTLFRNLLPISLTCCLIAHFLFWLHHKQLAKSHWCLLGFWDVRNNIHCTCINIKNKLNVHVSSPCTKARTVIIINP